MTPVLDGTIYAEIHDLLQEEPVEERNMTMMGMLTHLGISKGEPFAPNAEMQAVFDKTGPEALEYLIASYHRSFNLPFYEGKNWSTIVPNGAVETEFSWEYPTHADYIRNGTTYYGIISSAKNYGSATFYLDLAEDPSGDWLFGDRHYKITVPSDVPVRDFWSITTSHFGSCADLRVPSRALCREEQQESSISDGTTTRARNALAEQSRGTAPTPLSGHAFGASAT
jgi:hypothetical protein